MTAKTKKEEDDSQQAKVPKLHKTRSTKKERRRRSRSGSVPRSSPPASVHSNDDEKDAEGPSGQE